MPRLLILGSLFALLLTACAAAPAASTASVSYSTASVSTVMPFIVTPLPPDYTPPPTLFPPTLTPIPALPGGLGPSELKYRILAEFPDLFFCDPDYYPIARADEMDLARERFPDVQANTEEFQAILAHNQLGSSTTFADDQKLLIYKQHKKLAAIQFELKPDGYQFHIQVAKTKGSGELISGLIDGQGKITVQERKPSIATCPICLAVGTSIDSPGGPVAVESLRAGMWVWTVDHAGRRIAQPVVRVGKTVVPASHKVVHLILEDGRELWVSPGHPVPDGRRIGDLRRGDPLDGSLVRSAERVRYTGDATYDLLPAGETGFYWANGILMSSTFGQSNRTK